MLLLLHLLAAAASNAETPQAVATAFYRVHQQSRQDGVPDARLLARYAPYLSPELAHQLADGADAERRYAKSNADSPPLVEGDLFSSNFEGVTAFQVGVCDIRAKATDCRVQLQYAPQKHRPQDRPVNWLDTLRLVKTPAGWRVDDIAYGATWSFGNHGTLKATLRNVIAEAPR
ncbi:MAG: hypothetical protein JO056_01565 [Alphaproteobacteria bacterium]|nr:hypothetical protein [Alphaproteobacteria bacterium]